MLIKKTPHACGSKTAPSTVIVHKTKEPLQPAYIPAEYSVQDNGYMQAASCHPGLVSRLTNIHDAAAAGPNSGFQTFTNDMAEQRAAWSHKQTSADDEGAAASSCLTDCGVSFDIAYMQELAGVRAAAGEAEDQACVDRLNAARQARAAKMQVVAAGDSVMTKKD